MSSEKTPLKTGSFCWVDVAVSDPTVTHKFFSELFGWQRRVRPTEEATAYSIMTAHDEHVAGVCAVEENGPSQWMAYLLVEQLAAGEKRVEELGGKVLRSAVEIPTFGTLSVVEDPAGAIFALWQTARTEFKKPRLHGTVSWYELASAEPDKVKPFYAGLCGWTIDETSYDGAPFTIFEKEGREHAGLRACKGDEPSHWIIYFAVDNCDDIARACPELGGTVVTQPFDVEGLGRCAMLRDPSGGYFGAFEYSPNGCTDSLA